VKQLGIGLGTYVEMTSIGGGTEFASVEMHEDGHATVKSGLSPSGQGHETSLAQVASRALGIPFEHVRVVHSDTGVVSRGEGTWGSRSLQIGGSAVLAACEKLKAEGGTYAEVDFTQTDSTFPFGAHVAVVEVDTETGGAELVKMVAVDDAGVALNPMMMQGQIHGGVAQGIAQALFEEMTYDEDGNPMNANLATYAIPSAADLPSFETVITQTPTDRNPLGAKGIGESGTIGATPAVQNAVVDAVSHLGVTHIDMPLVPERVWRAIQDARATR
jgi:carbon-monoxide dehydrogenase large subunit